MRSYWFNKDHMQAWRKIQNVYFSLVLFCYTVWRGCFMKKIRLRALSWNAISWPHVFVACRRCWYPIKWNNDWSKKSNECWKVNIKTMIGQCDINFDKVLCCDLMIRTHLMLNHPIPGVPSSSWTESEMNLLLKCSMGKICREITTKRCKHFPT